MSDVLMRVDENDNEIGAVDRTLAHTDASYMHREVAILIFNEDNKILFHHRSDNKKVVPGWWIISVTGHVDAGDETLDCAH